MSNRRYDELPQYVSFTQVWRKRGEGRYWKRLLAKKRRKAWKDSHERGVAQFLDFVHRRKLGLK